MSRVLVRSEVEVAAPAGAAWAYLADWARQEEWIPLTRVEPVGSVDGVGGRIRAWTGLGPLGFWDTMTVTAWETDADAGSRCEVLHTGALVRGEGGFTVHSTGPGTARVVWWEHLQVPGGPVGALVWRVAGRLVHPLLRRGAARTLARFVDRVGSGPVGPVR